MKREQMFSLINRHHQLGRLKIRPPRCNIPFIKCLLQTRRLRALSQCPCQTLAACCVFSRRSRRETSESRVFTQQITAGGGGGGNQQMASFSLAAAVTSLLWCFTSVILVRRRDSRCSSQACVASGGRPDDSLYRPEKTFLKSPRS